MLADRHLFVQLEFAGRQFLKHDVGRHELGEARRLDARRRVFRGQNLAGAMVDHDVRARIDLRRGGDRRIGGTAGAGGAGGAVRRSRAWCGEHAVSRERKRKENGA